jgi:hypothetical protein
MVATLQEELFVLRCCPINGQEGVHPWCHAAATTGATAVATGAAARAVDAGKVLAGEHLQPVRDRIICLGLNSFTELEHLAL